MLTERCRCQGTQTSGSPFSQGELNTIRKEKTKGERNRKEVIYGGGGVSFLVNLIWIVFFGLEMAIGYVILGCLWCITLLGIPIGKQCFKMAKLSLMPFGASVI